MGFSRQEYWSGLPFLSPGDLPDPGLNPCLLHCRQTLLSEPPGNWFSVLNVNYTSIKQLFKTDMYNRRDTANGCFYGRSHKRRNWCRMGILNLCMSTCWACGQAYMVPFLPCFSFIHSGPYLICYCYHGYVRKS